MTKEELSKTLADHQKWLNGEGGERANLQGANLRGANLRGADLYKADLYKADLREADLREADLRRADLWRADLYKADLREADLREADLQEAKLNNTCAMLQCPESGAFEAWKKCRRGVIVKLLIPAEAKRSSATTRKCRANEAKVLGVYGAEEGISSHDSSIVYRVGETVKPDSWDENRWDECSHGIHFFITRQEAEGY